MSDSGKAWALADWPVGPAASDEVAANVYAPPANGKRHACPRVVSELLAAERAWGYACASSFHLVRACKQRDEATLHRRWAMHATGPSAHAPTSAMITKAVEEGSLDARAWGLIESLNHSVATAYRVAQPMAPTGPMRLLTLPFDASETVAAVCAKVEAATLSSQLSALGSQRSPLSSQRSLLTPHFSLLTSHFSLLTSHPHPHF